MKHVFSSAIIAFCFPVLVSSQLHPSPVREDLLNPLVKRVRNSTIFAAFLDAVNVASVAIIAVICVIMGMEAITDWRTIVITVVSFAVVFGFRNINSAFIVIGGSLLGYLLTLIG